jgi:hypothetical protein
MVVDYKKYFQKIEFKLNQITTTPKYFCVTMSEQKEQFNKAKLNNLIKRIEKHYDCEYSERILEVIRECYEEECEKVEINLAVKKDEYLKEYQYQQVLCECGKKMKRANIYNHKKKCCPLRLRSSKEQK